MTDVNSNKRKGFAYFGDNKRLKIESPLKELDEDVEMLTVGRRASPKPLVLSRQQRHRSDASILADELRKQNNQKERENNRERSGRSAP